MLAACSSNEDVPDEADELQASMNSAEVVGSLKYGQTVTVLAPQQPSTGALRRKLLSFQATSGDEVTVRVSEAGQRRSTVDPVASLLDSKFRVLAENDNEGFLTKRAKISHTVASTGTHYIAFRDKSGWREPVFLTISLSKKTAVVPVVPVTSFDPFDGETCTGAPLSIEDAEKRLPFGSTGTKEFPGSQRGRTRSCKTGGDCSAWSVSSDVYVASSATGERAAAARLAFMRSSTTERIALGLSFGFYRNDVRNSAPYGGAPFSLALPTTIFLNAEERAPASTEFAVDVRATCFRAIARYATLPQVSGGEYTESELVVWGQLPE